MTVTDIFPNIQKCSPTSPSFQTFQTYFKQITRDRDLLAYLSFSLCNSSISVKFLVIPTSSSKCISCFLPSQSQYFSFCSSLLSSPLFLSCLMPRRLASSLLNRLSLFAFAVAFRPLAPPVCYLPVFILLIQIRNFHLPPSHFHPNLS